MKPRHPSQPLKASHVLVVALAIGAATGWGMWLISGRMADQVESGLREQISTLAQRQTELLAERTQAQAAKVDLATLQSQIAALHEDIRTLTQSRDKVQAELAAAQGALSDMVGKFNHGQADASETGSTGATFSQPQEVVAASAQRALTKLGYGPLAADGVVGPSTRQAIEEFQYKNGLPVTKELDTATLRRLTGAAAVSQSQ